MSSLRNAVQRKNHKERSQLSHRAKYGILEKHKDYVLRARDYHSKQDRIRRLRQKATDRNKDEFYFGMVNQKTQKGVHVQDRGNVAMPEDMVKILKSQDENYIRSMRTLGLKKIDRLKEQLTALADLAAPSVAGGADDGDIGLEDGEIETLRSAGIIKGKGKSLKRNRKGHILFVDSEEDARRYMASSSSLTLDDPNTLDTTEQVDLGWKVPEPKKTGKKNASVPSANDPSQIAERREETKQHRARLLKELAARLSRDTQLRYAERELEMQKLLMGKGGSKKLRGVEKVEDEEDDDDSDDDLASQKPRKTADQKVYKPRVYKWRMERKR